MLNRFHPDDEICLAKSNTQSAETALYNIQGINERAISDIGMSSVAEPGCFGSPEMDVARDQR
jgi:hypothetical protein